MSDNYKDDFQLALEKLVRAYARSEEPGTRSLRAQALRIVADQIDAENGGEAEYFNHAARKWVPAEQNRSAA